LLIVGIISACQDLYTPEIEKFPNALVVEGMITDQNDYVTVKLTRSASFNEGAYFFGEKKATVTIESTGGDSFSTTEISRGNYQTNEPIPTEVGEGYFVHIFTSGGEEYRSETEYMMPASSIDSIYLTDSIFRDLNYNYWGEPVVKDYTGITFAVLPKEPEGGNVGFIYKWNSLINYYVYSTAGLNGFSYFCWDEMESNTIYVYDYFHDEYINELPIGDLHSLSYYTIGPLPIDSTRFEGTISSIYTSSMYYHLKQYTVTKKGAKFWQSVKNQSEASGKLFDPVEEQIYGNIVCISDSSKVAFGYFNVASYADKIISVKLNHDRVGERKIVEFMPQAPSDEDCILNRIPEFWF
jgi:hypothetical protein